MEPSALSCPIVQLPEHILVYIFKHLSLKDQISVANTCEYFASIVGYEIWRKRFRETVIRETAVTGQLDNTAYKDLFKHTVEYIEKFTITDRVQVFWSEAHLCYLRRPELDFYLSFQFPRLKTFEFVCYDEFIHNGALDDSIFHEYLFLELMKKCPQLQRLKATANYITGVHIKGLAELRELYLPYCSLTAKAVTDILQNCAKLTHLDVSGFKGLSSILCKMQPLPLRHLMLSEEAIDDDFVQIIKEGAILQLSSLSVVDMLYSPTTHAPSCDLLDCIGSRIVALNLFGVKFFSLMSEFEKHAPKLTALHTLSVELFSGRNCLNRFVRVPGLKHVKLITDCWFKGLPALVNIIERSEHLARVDVIVAEDEDIDDFASITSAIASLELQKRTQSLAVNVVRPEKGTAEAARNKQETCCFNQQVVKITLDTLDEAITYSFHPFTAFFN